MMTNSFCRGRDFLRILALLFVLLPFCAAKVTARNCVFEDSWRFSVNLEGTNQLRLKMPLYDKDDYDCWVVSGTVYIQIEGQEKETLFYCEAQQDIDRDDYLPRIYCYKGVDGPMTLYRDRGYSSVSVGTTKGNDLCPCLDNQDYAIVNLLWDIPNKFRGKKVTISWSIHHNGNLSESNCWLDISPTTMTIPSAPPLQYPMIMEPIISFELGRPNQMMVPYMMAASEISSITAYYTEVRGKSVTNKSVSLGTASSDFVWLPADVCVKNFYIKAVYKDNEEVMQTTESSKRDLPVMHHAKRLSASMLPNGNVLINWGTIHNNWSDLSPSDTWEIQRNVTGDPTNGQWTGVGQVSFDKKATEYSFVDESLPYSYQNQDVYYRIRRSVTALWEWGPQSGYAMTKLPATLALPSVSQATVSRSGKWTEVSHPVTLNFALGSRTNYDTQGRIILRDTTDWKTFVKMVEDGKGKKTIDAIMAADISVTQPVGTSSASYLGTFDGNGHTLTVNINGGKSQTAPFAYVSTCTIRNLRIRGTVAGGIHSAGLVSNTQAKKTVIIESCHISTHVTGTGNSSDAPHLGGIVGHGGNATIVVKNCLFDGSITGVTDEEHGMENSYAGAFIGWQDEGAISSVENCLEQGTYTNINHAGANYKYISTAMNWGGTNNYTSNNWGECKKTNDLNASELAMALGESKWQVVGTNVVPIMTVSEDESHKSLLWDNRAKVVLNIEKTVDGEVRYVERHELTDEEREAEKIDLDLKTACVDHQFKLSVEQGESKFPLSYADYTIATKTETGEEAIYKFDNNVVIGEITIDTLQNAVSLSWECKRGLADFYRIKRYDKLTPDIVETLEDNYTQMAYIDRKVRPQHSYIYIIEGVTQCEGNNISSNQKEGACCPTGMVRGYVRLSNGIGLPGYTVTATPIGNINGAEILTCVTDSTGYFEIGGLVYQKYGDYMLTASDSNGEATFAAQSVTFDEDINLHTNILFTQTNYYTFSGYVLYDGSSIPVSGVRFLRDGVEVVNSSGKVVTTNNQGAFEVSIPQGSHRIQVVKDGHVFKNDGYFITPDAEPDSTWHNWQKDISEIYLWDETKVNLQGRVVGGNKQGLLPLGESLSKNNLGDNITIVMQLEGDNTSWIVRDQLNASVKERHEKYAHGKSDTTRMDAYRHRIEIFPDETTGEYCVPLYPVKYKVTEIYAEGYPTLFQTGMLSETVDLNTYADGDTVNYSRIYHAQPTLDIWQFNGTQDRYYGIKKYTSMDNVGTRDTVYLWKDGEYSMGYPVFMAGASVPMLLSAREEYRYNNEELGTLDIVQLDSGTVYVSNGLVGTDVTDEVPLDSTGQASYVFTPQNTTFTLEDDMALRTMKFTLLYDGSYYDIEPINAYVMAAMAKTEGRRIIAGQNTHLVDILRDPPGSNSSSYIEKGTHFNYNYTADYSIQMGINVSAGLGDGSEYFTGFWGGTGGGTTAGNVGSVDNLATLSWDLGTTHYEDWEYNYDFETTERISTSDHEREVGCGSDLFIGMTDNIIVEDAIAVRVVNSQTLQRLKPGIGGETEVNGHTFNVTGTAKVLARGWDAENEDSIYLIRDEVLQAYSKINSTFVHSQKYLLDELIPNLIRSRNALLMDSTTTSSYAQALANNMKQPVYVSKVSPENEHFSENPYYTMYKPDGMDNQWNDTIQALNNQIQTWVGLIATNEKEKLEATDVVKIYDFDGSSNIDYSETFNTSADLHRYWSAPSAINLTGDDGANWRTGSDELSDRIEKKEEDNKITQVEYNVLGLRLQLNVRPLFGFDYNYMNGVDSTYTKESGFTLACSRLSNLSVGVYHIREISPNDLKTLFDMRDNGQPGKYVDLFYKNAEYNLDKIYNGIHGANITSYINALTKVPRFRNFVFRTLGGATASPWEEERRTIFYNPGTILDQKTQRINKLRIWAKESSVSNVPYGDPARFTIYITNESELPTRVKKDLTYYLEDESNPNGAKVLIDGCPLTGSGQDLWLEPNTIIEKQVEVYASAEYDYEDIAISLMDSEDVEHVESVTISAHFVPAAGKINISKPGDKWVVNTESAYDEERQAYYLPVHIDGFDVTFRNFDHIELQYKLSTQGDKDWVNICSYYRNDEEGKALMELASGERMLMKHDGYIDAAFYGEKDPVEQYYDIRAVTYCRHGNGYLTRSSNILKGIKDTRRPQLFGTPQPVDGILDIGEDIILRFSEPIAGNYLSPVNNFEVLGLTNQRNVSLATAMQFDGKGAAVSLSNRNLAAKDFTLDMMIRPRLNGQKMDVFSHTMNEKAYLNMGVTSEGRLVANLNGMKIESDVALDFSEMRHVAYVFDVDEAENKTDVTFYNGTNVIGKGSFNDIYNGMSYLVFGNNFDGEMLEVRLWNKAMTSAELGKYAQKRLTGYELGLIDNYPMDEGSGEYAYDKAVGSNDLLMIGTTWKVPDGISMKLDGKEGIKLNPKQFNRQDYEDYTLMMWFRTNDENGTLMSNGEAKDEAGWKNHFNIGMEDYHLFFRSGGQQVTTNGTYADGSWHHLAVTVNRSRNVGNLYIDEKLELSFAVDTLGGISGNHLYLGATYNPTTQTFENPSTGNIDEVAMYEMALPENVLKLVSKNTPSGEEMGLLAYLPFSRSEKQLDNSQRMMPSGISLKKYKDNHGDVIENQRDTVVSQDITDRYADRQRYAPMVNSGMLENIKYSYVAKDNELYLNLDVPDYQIEKTNIYATVKEVADLQGNLMASPVTMDLYIYRTPLRWNMKRQIVDVNYGEETVISTSIENLSGKSKDYRLEGLPQWMTASKTSGKIGPLDEEHIALTISPYTNIGDYEEVIYIVGENDITEPLRLTIRVRGESPDWAVDEQLKAGNVAMHIVARVLIDNEVAHDTDDMLAAVGSSHRILGMAHVKQGATENDGLVYLTIYNTANANGTPLNFEFYDASSGHIYVMERPGNTQTEYYNSVDTIYFKADTIMGTAKNPVILRTQFKEVQMVKLEKGWNWISTYMQPEAGTINDLLDGMATWEVGDGLELIDPDGAPHLLTYKSVYDRTTYSNVYYWDNGDKTANIDPQRMYRFYAQSPKTIYITGNNLSYKGVTVRHGWNRIGYLSQLNLPIATALSDYTDMASEGDVIKSQNEFAVLNIDASGNRLWKGTLEYLRTGEGYMLKRNADNEHSFWYPHYNTESKYRSVKGETMDGEALFHNTSGSSMNIIARVEGFDLQEGDRLVAYGGSETRGMVEASEDGTFFLTIGKGEDKSIGFAIERDGEIVATASMQLPYIDNDVKGTLDEPTAIRFIDLNTLESDGWYTLQGIRLQGKPQQRGVYIHNASKVTIR